MNYHPKGSQCASCQKQNQDCSALPFDQYPVHKQEGSVAVVICKEFERHTCNFTPSAIDGGMTLTCECGAWK